MYIPLIKDKYSLIDLTRYGTRARKNAHSNVLIGVHPPFPIFKEGDILDANATYNLVRCSNGQSKEYDELSERVDKLEESVTELEEKHDQDIQEVYEYIEGNRTMVVYDGLEENLLVYNVKHG